jgi:Na+-transporting NADH:ubiquinone oxidoreductase subunit C
MKDRILMLVFVLLLGSLLTAALLLVNQATEERIQQNTAFKLRANVLTALDIPYGADLIDEVFARSVEERQAGEKSIYLSSDGSVAMEFAGSGLWGPIRGIIALEGDLKTIKGVSIIHQEETPGLGGRIAEKSYLEGFKNKLARPRLELSTMSGGSSANSIDAISGATLTSRSFIAILNDELEAYASLIEGAVQ